MDRRDFLLAATGIAATGEFLTFGPSDIRAEGVSAPGAAADAKSGPSIEQRLADFALAITYDDLPKEIVAGAKRLLLDTLGCGYGAIGSAPAVIAERTWRASYSGKGSATILGNAQPISTEGAALVNGVLVRFLDYNDIYVGSGSQHPSEIIPIALAACEEAGVSGRDFIAAMVAGYETITRINDAVSFAKRGFHSLSAAIYAAPLVAGKAWNMPVEQIAHAVGISGARGLTLFVVNSGAISMMKALGHAYCGMDGFFAARLAAEGFTGPTGTLDWVATKIQPAQDRLDIDLDPRRFRLPMVGLKRFPLQFEIQAPVEAGVNLHPSLKASLGDIREIVVETYPDTIERVAGPGRYAPATRETADHSLPVCLAMALLDGDVTTRHFEQDRWRAPEVLALAAKTKVRVGEALVAKMPKGRGSRVAVTLGDGRVLSETVEIPEGDAKRPMSAAALEHKFLTLSVPVLGEPAARKVMAEVDRLERLDDVRELTAALRGQA
jgi:2-methylcitrate dehydratase